MDKGWRESSRGGRSVEASKHTDQARKRPAYQNNSMHKIYGHIRGEALFFESK